MLPEKIQIACFSCSQPLQIEIFTRNFNYNNNLGKGPSDNSFHCRYLRPDPRRGGGVALGGTGWGMTDILNREHS